jgi:N4-(beta-N-acetylglucosaminyl)-L-asparaginase
MQRKLDRRAVLGAGAASAALACANAPRTESLERQTSAPPPRKGAAVMVGSANALAGMQLHYAMLEGGSDPLDAAIEVVKVVEADPKDTSVGLGGLPNEDGVVQLDAAVMHGPLHCAGAVASLENILHPSVVARDVMQHTDHVLLVGKGAYEFARKMGHEHVELLTPESRKTWEDWKAGGKPNSHWIERLAGQKTSWLDAKNARIERTLADVRELERLGHEHAWGTVHCSALSVRGEVACTTTTSGLAWKVAGRVGDSPIIGAGLYCDQEAGSAGSTGRGETAILAHASSLIVDQLRLGKTPLDAGMEALKRIVREVDRQARWLPALKGADGKPSFNINFYVLALDGRYGGVTLKGAGKYAVAGPDREPRHEKLESLLG